jgi:hypothetical protein
MAGMTFIQSMSSEDLPAVIFVWTSVRRSKMAPGDKTQESSIWMDYKRPLTLKWTRACQYPSFGTHLISGKGKR